MPKMLYNTAMHIKSSLDWAVAESELLASVRAIKSINYDMQARKLIKNLQPLVTELSNLELLARRNKQKYIERDIAAKLEQINTEINSIEQWVLMLSN
jgi:hypothetical protein